MSEIIACIDGSSFADSVCDHAAWFAGRMDRSIGVLHSRASDNSLSPGGADAVLAHALRRLRDLGLAGVTGRLTGQGVVDAAAACDPAPALVVMGKRGLSTQDNRRVLGGHVDPLIRRTQAPVCLAPRLFLPITRALVLADADMERRRAVEFALAQPGLADLDLDLAIVARSGQSPAEKVAWARRQLASRRGNVLTLEGEDLDAAVAGYMETRRTDLVIVSRAVLLSAVAGPLTRTARGGLWSWRTPVLVC